MASAENTPKDAIIFVPGLGREAVDQQIGTIARRLIGALERQADSAEALFEVVGAPEEGYGKSYVTKVRRITIQDSQEEATRPLVDIFDLDYPETITKRFNARNPLSKALVMMLVLIAVGWKSLLSMTKPSKTLKEKLQMIYIAGIIGFIVLYMGMMLSAGLGSLTAQFPELKSDSKIQTETADKAGGDVADHQNGVKKEIRTRNEPTEAEASNASDTDGKDRDSFFKWLFKKSQELVLIIMLLGLFKKKSFKETLSTVATEFVCAANYLRLASQKQAVLGQAAALLEHIADKKEEYDSVYIVAYSFGSIVSLDLLFPHARPGVRIGMVESLVTIGCPFDMVRTYWPNYFMQRQKSPGELKQWINLYAPLDIFGSNFRDDADFGVAEQGIILEAGQSEIIKPSCNIPYQVGIQTRKLTTLDILTAKGGTVHSEYWTGNDEPEASCFDDVAAKLFGAAPQSGDA